MTQKVTQKKKVLKYMKDFGSITQMDATNHLKITCLAERIRDLRKEGFVVIGTPEKSVSADGTVSRYTRYSL